MEKTDKIKVTFEVSPGAMRTATAVLSGGDETVYETLDKIIADTKEVVITDETIDSQTGLRFALSGLVFAQIVKDNKLDE